MFRVLVEARGNVVHYDTLQDRLWPDDTAPRQVRNCLQAYASHLRRTLAPLGVEVVSVRDRGYRLVDLEHRSNGSGRFEADAAEISAVRDRLATERAYSLSIQRQWADERRVYLRLGELVRGQLSIWEGGEIPEGWDPDKVMRDLAECLSVLDRSVGPEGSDGG